jgi:C_GCAxxG_C_C family probable redox protein
MSRKDDALSIFKTGANCAQSVLCSCAGDLGMEQGTARRVSAGFGGGMGRLAGTCGAVTGAFMVLGLRHGSSGIDQKESKELVYGLVREFAARFTEKNGSLLCRELLGCDIGSPDGMKEAKARDLFATRCAQLVGDSVEIVEKML